MTWWSTVTWDVARAGGITAYALLTLSVLLGLALSLRWQRPQWPRLIANEMHSFLTLLSLVFVAIHVAAVWIDPFTRFGWREVLVPLASHYRPLWMGLGIVALYLSVAIWISTLVRTRIGYAWWRRLHALTFIVYALSTVHGIATGSDTRTAWALGLYAGGALLVGVLMTWRFLTPIGPRGRSHPWLAALTTGTVVVGAPWTIAGPARPGWNTWANNGQGTGGRSVAAALERQQATRPDGPLTAMLRGTLTQSGPDASGTVTLRFATNLADGTKRWLDVVVQGTAGDDGQLNVSRTQVDLGAPLSHSVYQGSLTALQGDGQMWRMAAELVHPGTSLGRLQVTMTLHTSANGQVSGIVHGTPTNVTIGVTTGGESESDESDESEL